MALKREVESDVDDVVAKIIADVRENGLDEVLRLTTQFDRLDLSPDTIEVSKAEIDAAVEQVSREETKALELAARRIKAYHERQVPDDARWTDADGVTLGWRWSAVDSAGIYVPGGFVITPRGAAPFGPARRRTR